MNTMGCIPHEKENQGMIVQPKIGDRGKVDPKKVDQGTREEDWNSQRQWAVGLGEHCIQIDCCLHESLCCSRTQTVQWKV